MTKRTDAKLRNTSTNAAMSLKAALQLKGLSADAASVRASRIVSEALWETERALKPLVPQTA